MNLKEFLEKQRMEVINTIDDAMILTLLSDLVDDINNNEIKIELGNCLENQIDKLQKIGESIEVTL